ncbi:MAG TPA: hypothetical protein VNT02_10235, partial [Burkholderiales bacterium]|nr:hypothetical protein [Burkholderiales bacterium]
LRELGAKPDAASRVRELARAAEDGRAKLWTIWRALELRREQPDLFEEGNYQPLQAGGLRSEHVVAYARCHGNVAVIAIAGRLWAKLGGAAGTLPLGPAFWADTAVDCSALRATGTAVNVLTGKPVHILDGGLRVAEAFADFPGALIYCKA